MWKGSFVNKAAYYDNSGAHFTPRASTIQGGHLPSLPKQIEGQLRDYLSGSRREANIVVIPHVSAAKSKS